MAKNSFKLYIKDIKNTQMLSDAQLGKIVRGIAKFVDAGEIEDVPPELELMFMYFINQEKALNKAYEERCEQNRKNIQNRWNDTNDTNCTNDTNDTDQEQDQEQDKEIYSNNRVRAYVKFFSENIGVVSPTIATEAESFIDDGMDEGVIVLALKESVDNGAKNWKYAKAVLQAWLDKGIKTEQQAAASQLEFKNRKKSAGQKDNRKNFAQHTYTDEDRARQKAAAIAEIEAMDLEEFDSG